MLYLPGTGEAAISISSDAAAPRVLASQRTAILECARHRGLCQFGPHFVCQDGPVFAYDRIAGYLAVRSVIGHAWREPAGALRIAALTPRPP